MKRISAVLVLTILFLTACAPTDSSSGSSPPSSAPTSSIMSGSLNSIPPEEKELAKRLEENMEKENESIAKRKAELEESGLMP